MNKNKHKKSNELKLIDMTIRAMSLYRGSVEDSDEIFKDAKALAAQAEQDLGLVKQHNSHLLEESAKLRQELTQMKMTILKAETIMRAANNYLTKGKNINPGTAIAIKIEKFLNKEEE